MVFDLSCFIASPVLRDVYWGIGRLCPVFCFMTDIVLITCYIYIFCWSLMSGCRFFLLSHGYAHPSSHHFQIALSLGEPLEVEPWSRLVPQWT